MFDLHGWEGTSERLHELQRAGDLKGMAATITDEMLADFTALPAALWILFRERPHDVAGAGAAPRSAAEATAPRPPENREADRRRRAGP